MARREVQVFNMSFLDMMTNFLGAVIVLFLLSALELEKRPAKNIARQLNGNYDDKTQQVTAKVDPSALGNLKKGDTLLIIINDTKNIPIAEAAKQQQTQAYRPPEDDGKIDTAGMDLVKRDPPKPGECRIYPRMKNVQCNDNNTPNNPDDDTFTAEVEVASAGTVCATLWKDDQGSLGALTYGTAKKYGPYPIKAGSRRIWVSDQKNPSVREMITLYPSAPCSKVAAKPTDQNTGDKGTMPPGINFQLEFDEAQGNVDIYVEKGGDWVYGARKRNPSIGDWDDEKTGFIDKKKTGIERVRQLGAPQPGTYKIYAHYKSGTASNIKVALIVSSKKSQQIQKMEKVVPLTESGPRRGGGMLLKTVQVMPDGSLRF